MMPPITTIAPQLLLSTQNTLETTQYTRELISIAAIFERLFKTAFSEIGLSESIQQDPTGQILLNKLSSYSQTIFDLSPHAIQIHNPLAIDYLGIVHYLQFQCPLRYPDLKVHTPADTLIALLAIGLACTAKTTATQMTFDQAQRPAIKLQQEMLFEIQGVFTQDALDDTARTCLTQVIEPIQKHLKRIQEKAPKYTIRVDQKKTHLHSIDYFSLYSHPKQKQKNQHWLSRIKHFLRARWQDLIYFFKHTQLGFFKRWIRASERQTLTRLSTLYDRHCTIETKTGLSEWMDSNQTHLACVNPHEWPDTPSLRSSATENIDFIASTTIIRSQLLVLAKTLYQVRENFLKKPGVPPYGAISRFLGENCTWLYHMYDQVQASDLIKDHLAKRLAYLNQVKLRVFSSQASIVLFLTTTIQDMTEGLTQIKKHYHDYQQCEAQRLEVYKRAQKLQLTTQLWSWHLSSQLVSCLSHHTVLQKFCPFNDAVFIHDDPALQAVLKQSYLGQLLTMPPTGLGTPSFTFQAKEVLLKSGLHPDVRQAPLLLKAGLHIFQANYLLNDLFQATWPLFKQLTANRIHYISSYYLRPDLSRFFQLVQTIYQHIQQQCERLTNDSLLSDNEATHEIKQKRSNDIQQQYFRQFDQEKSALLVNIDVAENFLGLSTDSISPVISVKNTLKTIIQRGEDTWQNIDHATENLFEVLWEALETENAQLPMHPSQTQVVTNTRSTAKLIRSQSSEIPEGFKPSLRRQSAGEL